MTWSDLVGLAPFLVGWTLGWLLLWAGRPLPAAATTCGGRRRGVAVVVPARDEEHQLPHLLEPLAAALGPDDELVVVDDRSTDDTARVARAAGARVVTTSPPPSGWLGKPHACWTGARATTAEVLLFVDADVRPPDDLLDRIAAATDRWPDRVVSVQPWHRVGRPAEHLSVFFNIVALMAVGRFSAWGSRVHPRAAFGPVLAISRARYDAVGGHARPDVRDQHTEDIALARAAGGAELFTGRPDIAFRMYPGGLRELVAGWTRSIATGALAAPWWSQLATFAWVWSCAAGWTASWWTVPLTIVQLLVLSRRAGSFSPLVAVLYPVALTVFVIVVVRSLIAVMRRADVEWKGRAVPARSPRPR